MRSTRLIAAITLTLAGLVALVVAPASPAAGAPALTVDTITWNVVGLDSNDVTKGPATYPVGVRVCNTGGDAATATTATFTWTTASAALDLDGPAVAQVGTIGPATCQDVYWNVAVVRSASSYEAVRGYQITVASAEGAVASTPTPRELFVERLISQNRNRVNSITGPASVVVGDEVTYVVDANTAIAGFEQLEAFLTLPSSIFQLLRTSVTYAQPANATNDTMYADACGWDDVPTSPTYLSCIGPANYAGGKVGGALLTTFTVRVIGTGTAELTSSIYDKSGSSFHYNTDFSVRPNLLVVTALAQSATTTTTTAAPTTTTTVTPAADVTTTTTTTSSPSTTTPGLRPTVATTPTTAPPRVAAVAVTGRSDSQGLSLVGALLVALGLVAMFGARIGDDVIDATPLERSVHDLRRALHGRDAGAGAAQGWLLLDALDRTARSLRESDHPSA